MIRGNSPLGLLWKLEGIEIPNPNHFSNGQGDGGGVFSIISSDVLANSDFFTGAFPGEYGNSTSGNFSQAPALDGTTATNKNLKLTKAMHHVIGYDLSLGRDLRIKVEAYYQYLYNVPVTANPGSTYSRVNSEYGIPDSTLVNNGKGYNKGIEVTLEKFYADNYYFLATGSIFDSKYKPANGQTYNTYFNSKYQANLLVGKDFKVGKSGQNIFSINFKTLTRGGFRYTPENIGTTPSGLNYLYSVTSETYTKQMPYYLRFDLGMKYRRNNPRYSWIISLDIQNITNRQNVTSYETMIAPNNQIVPNPETGIGIIPVLNFKVEF